MNAPKQSPFPPLRCHKSTQQGYVYLAGKRHYFGRFDQPETHEAYLRFMAEWVAHGGQPEVPTESITVVEVCARYWSYAKDYYPAPDGHSSGELGRVKRALSGVRRLYGSVLATDFGPKALRTVRQQWIDEGLARTNINALVGCVRSMFRWAAILGAFLKEECPEGEGIRVAKPALFRAWEEYNGGRGGTNVMFSRRLTKRGVAVKKIGGVYHWEGIGLKENPHLQDDSHY